MIIEGGLQLLHDMENNAYNLPDTTAVVEVVKYKESALTN